MSSPCSYAPVYELMLMGHTVGYRVAGELKVLGAGELLEIDSISFEKLRCGLIFRYSDNGWKLTKH